MGKKVFVIAGPAASGKNTIIREIITRYPHVSLLVNATTRAVRPGEVSGREYYFFTLDQFDAEVARGHIPEQRYVPGLETHYGIYLPDLEKKLKKSSAVAAQVDISGARWLKEHYGATTIFIMPESLSQFRGRLRLRNPDMSEKEFDTRIKITDEEMRVHAPQYDYRVINADGALQESVDKVVEILRNEGYTLA